MPWGIFWINEGLSWWVVYQQPFPLVLSNLTWFSLGSSMLTCSASGLRVGKWSSSGRGNVRQNLKRAFGQDSLPPSTLSGASFLTHCLDYSSMRRWYLRQQHPDTLRENMIHRGGKDGTFPMWLQESNGHRLGQIFKLFQDTLFLNYYYSTQVWLSNSALVTQMKCWHKWVQKKPWAF